MAEFKDSIPYVNKEALSVRDGELLYYGHELKQLKGLDDNTKYVVKRSPATIGNLITKLNGLPVTNLHSSEGDSLEIGIIKSSRIIDFVDNDTKSTLAIANVLELKEVPSFNELSLEYDAELVQNNDGSISQINIKPMALAIVPDGRNGSTMRFYDAKGKDKTMDKLSYTQMRQIILQFAQSWESADTALLQKLIPQLKVINESQDVNKMVNPAIDAVNETPEIEVVVKPEQVTQPKTTEGDTVAPDAVANSLPVNATTEADAMKFEDAMPVLDKAIKILGASYSFAGKKITDIMRDCVPNSKNLSADEVRVAFKIQEVGTLPSLRFSDSAPDETAQFFKQYK